MNISFVSLYRYFIYRGGCDMRKGYDGLSGMLINEFKMSPLSGDVFVFISKPRNKIKNPALARRWLCDLLKAIGKRLEKLFVRHLPSSDLKKAEKIICASSLEAIGKKLEKLFVRHLP